MVVFLDEFVGNVIKVFKRNVMFDNFVIVFMIDNGGVLWGFNW